MNAFIHGGEEAAKVSLIGTYWFAECLALAS
jgi:hypothetical protein